jgi:hypothetical protein
MSYKEYYGSKDQQSIVRKHAYQNSARDLFKTLKDKQKTESDWLKSSKDGE